MKTFYRVESKIYDSGKITARVETVWANQKPENTYYQTAIADIYEDYFLTEKDAYEFKKQAENA